LVHPEEEERPIRVDQVRELGAFVSLSGSGAKVGLIAPAERMNRNAANSLLKTLEEPPSGTHLILVSHAPGLLPATVRSRCQALDFRTPSGEDALTWLSSQLPDTPHPERLLALGNGAPLRALELAETDTTAVLESLLADMESLVHGRADPVAVATSWQKRGVATVAEWTHSLVTDMVRAKQGGTRDHMGHLDLWRRLDNLSRHVQIELLFVLLDKTNNVRRTLERRLNLSEQCLLEDLALAWAGHGGRT
jgi:DNA polymerase-3 subunit delta'